LAQVGFALARVFAGNGMMWLKPVLAKPLAVG
jgi:hypothetical protein